MRWVVVGGGRRPAASSPDAWPRAGHDVTLVEAGSGVPPASFSTRAGPALFPGPFARGRGLGGSGAVNGMLATAGDLGQYERWGWTDAGDALARVRVPLEIPPPTSSDRSTGPCSPPPPTPPRPG